MMDDEVRVIAERYQLGTTLGKGQFAKVKLGWDVSTTPPTRVALKILRRDTTESDAIASKQAFAEMTALKSLAHRNVVRILDLHLDCLYPRREGRGQYRVLLIVLELVAGGQLFELIQYSGRLSERLARTYFQQLVDAVGFCHSRDFAHRDIKPENLLLDWPSFRLKVADFGLARTAPRLLPVMRTVCGTPKYMAPEVASGAYDGRLADAWSCGVVLFAMVAGFPPYSEPLQSDWWYHQLCRGNHAAFWSHHRRFGVDMSAELQSFLTGVLQVDPQQRLAVVDMVNDEWLRGETLSDERLQQEVLVRHKEVTRGKLVEDGEKKLKKAQEEQQRRVEEAQLHAPIIGVDDLYRSGGAAAEQEQEESKGGEAALPTAAPTMALGTLSGIAMSNGDAAAATTSVRLMLQQQRESEQDSARQDMMRIGRESHHAPRAMSAAAPPSSIAFASLDAPSSRLMFLPRTAAAAPPLAVSRMLMTAFSALTAAPAAAPAPAPVPAAPVPVYDAQLTVPSMTLLSSALPLRSLHPALMSLFRLNHFTVRLRERQHRYRAGIGTPLGSVVINLQLWRQTDSDDSVILLEFRRHSGDSAQYRELLSGLLVQMASILSAND